MSEQHLSVEQATQRVMDSLEQNVAKQLENYTQAISAINDMSIMSQRMATQRMILGVCVRQRILLEEHRRLAESSPVMLAAVEAQIVAMEQEIVGHLEEVGVPKKVAFTALESATQTVRIEVVQRDESGRIKSLTKANGVHN